MLINCSTIFKEEQKINPFISKFKVYIAKPTIANGYTFTKELLDSDEFKSTIPSSPVVAGFVDNDNGSQLGGHFRDLVRTKTGLKRTPQVTAIGYVLDQEPWWETYENEEWITAYAHIWTTYYSGLSNLSDRDIYQSMQVEMNVDNNNSKLVTDCCLTALCMMENVKPAFKNSTFEEINFSKNDFIGEIKYLQQEFSCFSKYSTINFSIPVNIKIFSENNLNLEKLTSVCKENLNYLNNNDYITPEKVSYIKSYFSRNKSVGDKETILNWCSELEAQMREIDKGSFSLNNNEESKEDGEKKTMTNKDRIEYSEKFSMTVDQILSNMNDLCSSQKYIPENGDCEWNRFYIWTFDAEYMYGRDSQYDCNMAIPFTISDDGSIVADFENVKKAKQMSIWLVEDNETFSEADDDDTYYQYSKIKTEYKDMEDKCADMEVKMGQQFASVTALESALADEKTISENRQKEIDELSAKFKASEEKEKTDKVNALMSKKEFKVFSEDDKMELRNSEKSYEDIEKDAYAKLGRFASNNITFDENGKFSFMFVETKPTNNNNKDDDPNDAYAKARKKYGAKNKNNMNESDGVK